MNTLIKISLLSLSGALLTQCVTLKKGWTGATDYVLGGPPVTKVTDASDYNPNNFRNSSIAAKVDKSVVTNNELNFMLSPVLQQLEAQFPSKDKGYDKEVAKATEQIFQELIDRELILNEFQDMGAQIPARQIDYEIKNRINNLYNGKRSLFLADLKKNGLSQAKYRTLVERTIAVGAMKAQHFTTFAPPTTAELKAEYRKFSDKLRDVSKDKAAYKKIWIKWTSDELGATPESQLELAQDVAKQLRNGADFAELAKEHSKDAFASEGGQWPMTPRFEFPVHFAPVVFQAPIGKIIGPLKDQSGLHIIQVTKRINGPSPAFDKVRPQLEQRVNAEKSAARFNRWIKRLRNKAHIQRNR